MWEYGGFIELIDGLNICIAFRKLAACELNGGCVGA